MEMRASMKKKKSTPPKTEARVELHWHKQYQCHNNTRRFVHTISVSHYRYYMAKRRVVKTMATNNIQVQNQRAREKKRKRKESTSHPDRYNGIQS